MHSFILLTFGDFRSGICSYSFWHLIHHRPDDSTYYHYNYHYDFSPFDFTPSTVLPISPFRHHSSTAFCYRYLFTYVFVPCVFDTLFIPFYRCILPFYLFCSLGDNFTCRHYLLPPLHLPCYHVLHTLFYHFDFRVLFDFYTTTVVHTVHQLQLRLLLTPSRLRRTSGLERPSGIYVLVRTTTTLGRR